MEVTINSLTGQMSAQLTKEEREERAQALVRQLVADKTEIILQADPYNPVDRYALAAYYSYTQCIGYVCSEECRRVRQLLPDDGYITAVVSGGEHVILTVIIPDIPQGTVTSTLDTVRKLPQLPFRQDLWLPFAPDEGGTELLFKSFLDIQLTPVNADKLLSMVALLIPRFNFTICDEDALRQKDALRKMCQMHQQYEQLGITEEQIEILDRQIQQGNELMSDFHREGGYHQIWQRMIARVKQNERQLSQFYEMYDQSVYDCPLTEASTAELKAQQQLLRQWLNQLPINISYRTALKQKTLGACLRYERYNRRELYDLLSVLLVMSRLDQELANRLSDPLLAAQVGAPGVPAPLCTPEAQELKEKLMNAQLVDEHYRPVELSLTKRAILANTIASILEIRNKWSLFESYWGDNNLAITYQQAIKQKNIGKFMNLMENL